MQGELTAVLAALPLVADPEAPLRQWGTWGWDEAVQAGWGVEEPLPPIRVILGWDNLIGHENREWVRWLTAHGVLPLSTPVGDHAGDHVLNMAEAGQRILVRRALSGQHPQSADELMTWLDAAVSGWNRDPTPFEWGGKRAVRRQRARERRHRQGGSGAYTRRRGTRRTRLMAELVNQNSQDK